eukprot:scaffold119146_cov18-Tisochrysis_lutea.AAC.1
MVETDMQWMRQLQQKRQAEEHEQRKDREGAVRRGRGQEWQEQQQSKWLRRGEEARETIRLWGAMVEGCLGTYLRAEEPGTFDELCLNDQLALIKWMAGQSYAAEGNLGPSYSALHCAWMHASVLEASEVEAPWWVKLWVWLGCSKRKNQQAGSAAGWQQQNRPRRGKGRGIRQGEEAPQQPIQENVPAVWKLPWLQRWELVDSWLCEWNQELL